MLLCVVRRSKKKRFECKKLSHNFFENPLIFHGKLCFFPVANPEDNVTQQQNIVLVTSTCFSSTESFQKNHQSHKWHKKLKLVDSLPTKSFRRLKSVVKLLIQK